MLWFTPSLSFSYSFKPEQTLRQLTPISKGELEICIMQTSHFSLLSRSIDKSKGMVPSALQHPGAPCSRWFPKKVAPLWTAKGSCVSSSGLALSCATDQLDTGFIDHKGVCKIQASCNYILFVLSQSTDIPLMSGAEAMKIFILGGMSQKALQEIEKRCIFSMANNPLVSFTELNFM